jgi:hypothetical protein
VQDITTRRTQVIRDVPQDLQILQQRLNQLGVQVELPTAGPSDPLPHVQEIAGEPLSQTIIDARRGA